MSNDAAIMGYAPISQPSEREQTIGRACVGKMVDARSKAADSCAMLREWYTASLDIARPNRLLLEPVTLSSDEFVEQIRKARGARKPLSAAAVQAVRQEYANTVQPMQAALREAEGSSGA